MKKQTGKKHLFLLALMIFIVMAVATGFWQQQRTVELQQATVKEMPIAPLEDSLPVMPSNTLPQQPAPPLPQPKEKMSYAECMKQWDSFRQQKTAALKIDQGKIQVTFQKTITYEEAAQKIRGLGFEVDKILNIFGALLKKKMSDAESFNVMHALILKSGKKNITGKEIETACGLLAEEEVQEASPILQFNFVQQ